MRFIFILIFANALSVLADEPAMGRWEGSIKIPDLEQTVVVDLAEDPTGAWTGSITMPGLGVKGAILTDIAFNNPDLSFGIKTALGAQRIGMATFKARLTPDGKLTGNFTQGGNTAPLTLVKIGAPQVEAPPHSTAVAKEMEGEWKGDVQLMGYPGHVTLKLVNQAAGAIAQLVVVGKKTNNFPVDLVTQEGNLLTIDSHDTGISFEGRWQKQNSEIKGTFFLGAMERPLVLRRTE